MNILTIFQEAASALGLLAAAGVPVPPALTNTVAKALPIVSTVANIAANPPSNASQVVTDIAAVAATIPSNTGVAGADTAIANIVNELKTVSTWKSNLESNQVALDFTAPYSLNGVANKAITVTFLETSDFAKQLGY